MILNGLNEDVPSMLLREKKITESSDRNGGPTIGDSNLAQHKNFLVRNNLVTDISHNTSGWIIC